MNIKHEKLNNMNLNMLQTKKFKTTKIQISFNNDLTEDNVTKRALLPYLMKSITKKFDTKIKLATHLEEMYAATFGTGVKKIGLTQIIVFDFSIINDKYTLNHDDLFEEGLDFLAEVFFNPLFTEDILQEEKRLLDDYYQSIYANKMHYSIKTMYESMFKDEVFSIPALGYEKDLENITLKDMISTYHDMIQNDKIIVNVIGDIDFEATSKNVQQKLAFTNRHKELVLIDDSEKPKRNVNEIFESQDVNQGKLVVGYHFPAYYLTDDYYSAIVFNTLVGSGTESLLFKRIREEKSLVYFINSGYDNYKGVFTIYSGINQKDYDEVNAEIDNILDKVIKSEYDDLSLVIAKKQIVSQLIESLDSNGSLTSRINNLSLFDKTFDLEKLVTKINHITKDDVSNVAKLVKKDTVFFLRNDNNE